MWSARLGAVAPLPSDSCSRANQWITGPGLRTARVGERAVNLRALAASFWSDENGAEPARRQERRLEPRHDCCGLKMIIRERRTLGILHLRNLSTCGACGITDMPLSVGSRVFLELTKSHYYTAHVKW